MTTVEPIRNKDEIKKVEKILAHQSQRDLVLRYKQRLTHF